MFESLIKKLQGIYLKSTVTSISIPDFKETPPKRRHYLFTGEVQGVGFRYQAKLLADRLFLSGWVKNLTNGQVEMEVQGAPEKIDFLINGLQNTGRIKISRIQTKQQDVDWDEAGFKILN
ncbi:acylphosphatase [Ligilactobacillus agilis]|uniref:acylphosphatase n=1 Tax=Ligilactobacillus agilis TaxID=1601 RepID=UPI001CDA9944